MAPPPPDAAGVNPSAASRMDLTGKRALVTGGHRGIGAAIVLGLAAAGAHVAVIDRGGNASRTSDIPSRVRGYGVEFFAAAADLGDPEQVMAVVSRVLSEFGNIDILVNNAGITELQPLTTTPVHPDPPLSVLAWDAQFAVNVRAPMLLAQAVAPAMVAARRGKIINVTSQAGTAALPLHAAYGASKAALDHLTRGMVAEWGRYNIQANAVPRRSLRAIWATRRGRRARPRR
eukprot:TRINITY_DN7543_c0_g1_i4.p2 TRINITY_DN7543_c0_g1~~TRINITY_DN7543_c0_g1_i4.p2  ORF type:complete len:266 (+),score=59.11 TRINITY_DN7543_c0_g1_i4:105-800(+)